MKGTSIRALGRITPTRSSTADRRRQPRREGDGREVIASQWVFDREERLLLKQLERRRNRRRQGDITAAISSVT